MRLGVGFTPLERRTEVVLRGGLLAEELGYDFVALAEGWSFDSTHLLAEIARRVQLAIRPKEEITTAG